MKRYAIVGTGSRSAMYIKAAASAFPGTADLVGLCDVNPGRLALYADRVSEWRGRGVQTYTADQFDAMLDQQRPDTVIVTTGPDRTHSEYIVRALQAGCDVVTEKPMTTSAERCREILSARDAADRSLQVTFNYRYSPPRSQMREILASGEIGEILSADFAWYLDTRHGADYFRRWHRKLDNSGSLLVHKATHHFDLVNWWLDDVPQEVSAVGSRRYYTPEHADALGLNRRTERCAGCPESERCPFFLDLSASEEMTSLYVDNETHDGYFRDRCVFSDEIDIWDTMALTVRYRRGTLLSYLLHAYSPIEGYRIALNGTRGRLEHHANENSYMSGDGTVPGELERGKVGITLIPEFHSPRAIEPAMGKGGHGGGDSLLLSDVFDPPNSSDPLRRRANQVDGTYSIMVGIAAYTSIQRREPVRVADLLGDAPLGERW